MPASAAVSRLAAGEPPINFAAHQFRAGNIAGARDDFEQMLAMLISAIHPGVRQIAAHPGDWGIDVLAGDLTGLVVLWQSKYFWPLVARGQQAQIRESFESALAAAERNGYQISRWVLCVPSSMDPDTARWWDRWSARRRRETGVLIDLWDETTLREMLARPDAAHVRRHYYDPYLPGTPPAARRALHDVDDEQAGVLDRALFVRQLHAAGHAEVEAAKHEFFNADLLAREIHDKGVRAELDALREADGVAYGIWEARFNALGREPDPLLPGLHAAVMGEIRESGAFPSELAASRVHHCGLMHRIVQNRRAGWVRHWRRIAEEEPA
ncbi:hypothetical protein [Actinoplanes sp. NPDC049265]|uniref:hypothetical protein n=1 Tax=Actinoplanes sp. NPDC049265 TaxID=3363902 RepID=UPI0037165A07